MEAGKERLTHNTARGATRAEVEELKRENLRPKQLVAELSLGSTCSRKRPYPASRSKAEACSGEGKPEGGEPDCGGLFPTAHQARAGQARAGQEHLLPMVVAAR